MTVSSASGTSGTLSAYRLHLQQLQQQQQAQQAQPHPHHHHHGGGSKGLEQGQPVGRSLANTGSTPTVPASTGAANANGAGNQADTESLASVFDIIA